jgi:rhamnosyltransferase
MTAIKPSGKVLGPSDEASVGRVSASDGLSDVGSPFIGAVVVTFRPNIDTLQRMLEALSGQVKAICLVDNGSGETFISKLKSLQFKRAVELVFLPDNDGIATAQNVGIIHLSRLGAQFLMLLDQDSEPAKDMVWHMLEAYRGLTRRGLRVAAVGPVTVDRRTGATGRFTRIRAGFIQQKVCREADEVCEVDFLIASGSLIPIKAIHEIGGMNEGYFIDHVDTEWCVRARMAGWQLFGVCGSRLTHAIGDDVIRVWFGRWRQVSVHAPVRDYYKLRNTVLMLKQTSAPWQWRVALLNRALLLAALMLVISPHRLARLKLTVQGLVDGLQAKFGAYQNRI